MLALSIGLFSVAWGSSPESPVVQVTPQSPAFTVTLSSNPSTGFRWFLVSKPDWMQVLSSKELASTSGRIGASGQTEWHFSWPSSECSVPRRATITMVYARQWLPASSNDKKTSITVYCQ